MKTLILVLLVLCCAFSTNADRENCLGERLCIENYVMGKSISAHCSKTVKCFMDAIFHDDQKLLMEYRATDKDCFIEYLKKYRAVANLIIEYMYKGHDQPGRSELKSTLTKAVAAISKLCSQETAESAEMSHSNIELAAAHSDRMLSKCIYVYGAEKRMMDNRIFACPTEDESRDCIPYEKKVQLALMKRTGNKRVFFDSELDTCVHYKNISLEWDRPKVILTAILTRELSSNQKDAVKQKNFEFDFRNEFHILQCIEEEAFQNFKQHFMNHSEM